jgi:hypothetical protein
MKHLHLGTPILKNAIHFTAALLLIASGWSTVSSPWTTNAGWTSTIATNPSPAPFYRLRAN